MRYRLQYDKYFGVSYIKQLISRTYNREKQKRNKRNERNVCHIAQSCHLITSLFLLRKKKKNWLGTVRVTLNKAQLHNMKFPLVTGQSVGKCYWYLINAVDNMAIECY